MPLYLGNLSSHKLLFSLASLSTEKKEEGSLPLHEVSLLDQTPVSPVLSSKILNHLSRAATTDAHLPL